MSDERAKSNRDNSRRVPPWRGPMLLALVVILAGVLFLQQKPAKPKQSNAPTTTSTTTTLASATPTTLPTAQDVLQISSSPTWIPLRSPETLTLDTSSLQSRSGIAVSLELFPKIRSRSQYQVTLKYGVRSLPIASSPAVDLSQLTSSTSSATALNFEITDITPPASRGPQKSPTSYVQIPYCSSDCSGVYPLLAVFVKGSQIVGTALTEIALEPPAKASIPLNFALVVQAQFSGNPQTDINGLSQLVSALNANSKTDVTLDIPGALLEEVSNSTTEAAKQLLSQLTAWSLKPDHQIITSGFVPLNLPQLASSGMTKFIGEELTAGNTQSEQFLPSSSSSLGPVAVSNGLTYQTATALSKLGVSRVVLPANDFHPFNEKFSLSRPFLIATESGHTLTALSEDSELEHDISTGTAPYQSANRLSLDLAQIYFDQPNDANPRVVSAVIRVSSAQRAAKLNNILSDLSTSPFIKTVDLNSAFALTSNEQLSFGTLAAPPPSPTLNPTRFQGLSNDISALDSSLGETATLQKAKYNLLAAISPTLTTQASNKYLTQTQDAVDKISQMVSLASNKSFTVTARKVKLPIAISSKLTMPFKGLLVINSDRLSFPKGNSIPVVLNGPNTTLSIPIYAETLGIYLISAKLLTTNGKYVVAHTSIEIRSTAFSAASIILTLGAFLVLALWWIQSLRRGHQRNKRLVREKN